MSSLPATQGALTRHHSRRFWRGVGQCINIGLEECLYRHILLALPCARGAHKCDAVPHGKR